MCEKTGSQDSILDERWTYASPSRHGVKRANRDTRAKPAPQLPSSAYCRANGSRSRPAAIDPYVPVLSPKLLGTPTPIFDGLYGLWPQETEGGSCPRVFKNRDPLGLTASVKPWKICRHDAPGIERSEVFAQQHIDWRRRACELGFDDHHAKSPQTVDTQSLTTDPDDALARCLVLVRQDPQSRQLVAAWPQLFLRSACSGTRRCSNSKCSEGRVMTWT